MKDYQALGDTDLVKAVRKGDRHAYAMLWQRHSSAALTVARSFTSFDADDVVAEAFTRVFKTIRQGGGPTSAFRSYLFTALRHVAAEWGRREREITTDDLELVADQDAEQDALDGLERSLTAKAFTTLPTRWQEVLWYLDVESMTPRQVGPILGMRPNAVSALAVRAREGLRAAWIKAHLSSTTADPECASTLERLPGWSRGTLPPRTREQVDTHLAGCARCQIVAEEASTVNSRLALILLPLAAGIAGATAYAAAGSGAGTGATAVAAVDPAPVPMPAGVAATASTSTVPIGAVAAIAAASVTVLTVGGIAAGLASTPSAEITSASGQSSTTSTSGVLPGAGDTAPLVTPAPVLPVDPAPTAPAEDAPPGSSAEPEPAPGTPVVGTGEQAADEPAPSVPSIPAPASTPAPEPDSTAPSQPTPKPPSFTIDGRPPTVYPALTGTAEPGAAVTIRSTDGSGPWTVTADRTGAWTAELTGIHPGTRTITASQTMQTSIGPLTSAPTAPTHIVLNRPPTGEIAHAGSGQLYTIDADGIPGQTFRYAIPSTGFTSDELTFDQNGHWSSGMVSLSGTDVFFAYVSGRLTGPTQAAYVEP